DEIPPLPPPPSQTPTQQTPHIVSNFLFLRRENMTYGPLKWNIIWPIQTILSGKLYKEEMVLFGGNNESKKMQKYILKQQFKGFSVSNSEGLHKGYDRFQSLLGQLEIHGAGVFIEDANQKFLRVFEVDVKGYRKLHELISEDGLKWMLAMIHKKKKCTKRQIQWESMIVGGEMLGELRNKDKYNGEILVTDIETTSKRSKLEKQDRNGLEWHKSRKFLAQPLLWKEVIMGRDFQDPSSLSLDKLELVDSSFELNLSLV
ncbi:hypothetical protein Tco_0116678, partial [Tanacetum coccineum]